MSEPTNLPNSPDDTRAEALAWLAGQFRWEALLADLHELAEKEAAPVVDLEHDPEPEPEQNAEDAEDAA